MIINVKLGDFGGPMRMGDIIGTLNVVEHLRQTKNKDIKFYIQDNAILNEEYVIKFKNWLKDNTNFLSDVPGETYFETQNINLWFIRSQIGDLLEIENALDMRKKICIFPLFDAPYNQYRNWTIEMTNNFIDYYSSEKYSDYEKYICIHKEYSGLNLNEFSYSTDFATNINHILTCSDYVGGDTGMSHFVSILKNNKQKKLNYYYSGEGLLATIPFHVLKGKGRLNVYHNNSWEVNLL